MRPSRSEYQAAATVGEDSCYFLRWTVKICVLTAGDAGVGMSADVASEGEVWLSSQNRNFKNRMGKGKCLSMFAFDWVAKTTRLDWTHHVGGSGSRVIVRYESDKPERVSQRNRSSKAETTAV
jgi:hypothetical protein